MSTPMQISKHLMDMMRSAAEKRRDARDRERLDRRSGNEGINRLTMDHRELIHAITDIRVLLEELIEQGYQR